MRSTRGLIAVLVVVLWIGGLAMMIRRNTNTSEAQQLAEVALRLQPATFYYMIQRDGRQIGAAASSIDTSASVLLSEEYFVGDYPAPEGRAAERTSARWQTRLTRAFHLAAIAMNVARQTRPFSLHAFVDDDTTLFITGARTGIPRPPMRYNVIPPLFTPSLAPVAFMLGGSHEIGRKKTMSVFDPTTRSVIRPELTIRAESLFTVVDSAALNSAGEWTPVHRDTVRAWRIEGAPHGLSAWVDAEGRLVAATAGTLSANRTAFEIAFKNPQTK